MKLLMIYCKKFSYVPTVKTWEYAADSLIPATYEEVQAAFIQVEAEDPHRDRSVEKSLVNNLKWICRKNNTKHILLHSFAHLSESKAEPDHTRDLLERVQKKLENGGYSVNQTPFGYFLDLNIEAPGFSLARVFKNI
jgi:hypothetical protein